MVSFRRKWPPVGKMVAFQAHSRIGLSFRFTFPVMSLAMVEWSFRLFRRITRLPTCCSIVKSYSARWPKASPIQPEGTPLRLTASVVQSSITTTPPAPVVMRNASKTPGIKPTHALDLSKLRKNIALSNSISRSRDSKASGIGLPRRPPKAVSHRFRGPSLDRYNDHDRRTKGICGLRDNQKNQHRRGDRKKADGTRILNPGRFGKH